MSSRMVNNHGFYQELNKSERLVHDYILDKTKENKGRMRESMKDIGSAIGLSEATVYRAIRRLTKMGIVGINASVGKAFSNEIIYYGEVNETKQVEEIFSMANILTNNLKRLETLLSSKNNSLEMAYKERDSLAKEVLSLKSKLSYLEEQNASLKAIINEYEKGNKIFEDMSIDDLIVLDGGLRALVFNLEE